MNSRDTLYLENELEKLAAASPAVVAAVVKPGIWERATAYAKDPIVQAGMLIGAGTGISSAMRDYVPLDPTDPRARNEYKRRIGIGVASGVLLGIGASHGMRSLSAQVAIDISKKLDDNAEAIGNNLGSGVWSNIKDGIKRRVPFMRSDAERVAFAKPGPWWKPKHANHEVEKTPFNPGHAKQRMKDLAIIGASTGLGGGLGYLAGAALERRGYGAAMSPAAIGLTGAAVGLTVPLLMQYRNAVADEAMEQAGREYAAKRIAERAKVANQEQPEKFRSATRGMAAGMATGAGLAALTSLAFPKVRLYPALEAGMFGGALGGVIGTDMRNSRAAKRMTERAKVARLLASPQEWSEKEQAVIGGAGKGALIGTGVAGLSHLAFNKFPLALGLSLGGAAGAYINKKKLDRRNQALAEQQGY